ncbi:2-oxoglutarate dehydrogenase, E2 component, dihydrolipoamide succinyltransferase [Corynebacterium guangdongense]|uniref:Dihydrolipoamide acetyltransferase component of pyruvate dehydrogenase complex n=1 Tax=Corynebacterium guangdongense TaxID=1783348 RepID=A0ABU1ZXX0_9CORY|nr:2-oxoglutarate dehydrogenase, E2 component, dihydrolipoamide succinyltransferase [Corynebacterium guangdongense]MDR7329779.1 2-oxoglutarate dehydrogenase E2 component (dihydrolipoamide succinyltransferase) [Corynebacterium guangdongense]WJZ18342.1 Dihydrolipoyllysine-residue acetyltransferase component of pyruvate dehydrogenase complex [Corynebacterium guangdongense]
MAYSVEMPELGESVTEGTITQWLKSVGDTVEADEPLLEVSTDKVDTEIPSPVSGVLLEIKAEEDDEVEVGSVIAIIGEEGEAPAGDSGSNSSEQAEEPAAEEQSEAPAQEQSEDKPKAAPAASGSGSGSATDVQMPELGESVTEGTITQWLKSVGDTVEVDEPLLEVSTDKVDTEIPSPVAGTIVEILADEDDEVEVGAVIARIGDADAAPAEKAAPAAEEKQAEPTEVPSEAAIEEAESKDENETVEEAAPAASGSGSGSATDVQMPELGESVTEGTITQWLKSVGDTVEVDEPLLEVSTDKVDTEIPSPVAGTIVEILADEDDEVEVGAVIARIGDADAAPAEKAAETPAPAPTKVEKKEEKKASEKPKQEAPKAESAPAAEATPAASAGEAAENASSIKVNNSGNVPYVTPLVRKLAEKHGVDLNSLTGTGVGGRIRKQDVEAAAKAASAPAEDAAPAAAEATAPAQSGPRARWSTRAVDPEKQELIGTTQKVSRIRQITAAKMVEALQTSAQLTHVQEVDMTRIWDLRKKNKQAFVDKHGANPTFLGFIVKATAEALVSHPNVNASYNAETKEMTYHADVNIGIAVDTPMGLLVPVIKKAQDKSLVEIVKEIGELADKARNKRLAPDDLSGATFTVTNIGSEGALLDTPVLSPPQAGILGTAAIEKRPVVMQIDGDDVIAIRQMCYLPFTYDHQIVDGADAGRFVQTIKDRLETADFEADLNL